MAGEIIGPGPYGNYKDHPDAVTPPAPSVGLRTRLARAMFGESWNPLDVVETRRLTEVERVAQAAVDADAARGEAVHLAIVLVKDAEIAALSTKLAEAPKLFDECGHVVDPSFLGGETCLTCQQFLLLREAMERAESKAAEAEAREGEGVRHHTQGGK